MKTIITALYNLIAGMNPAVRAILAGGSLLLALNSYVNSLWAGLFSRVDQLVKPSISFAGDISPLALANYVFPLDTTLSLISAYGVLTVLCASIRIVKSFIPTIA